MSQIELTDVAETELIAEAVAGGRAAFGTLYERYLAQIYRYVYYQVTDHVEAEDLTELVFLKAWKALPRFRVQGGSLRAWLYRIAHNVVVDRHRLHRPTAALLDWTHLVDPSPLPETLVESDQESHRLAEALARLRPRWRQVILCRFISGLSHAETAEALGVSEGNVRVMQYRALKRMRTLLTEDADQDG
jgi:RNA polymerase sigma-70 factor (ECF subfamily)